MYQIAATPRPRWPDLPTEVHRHIERLLGAPVVAAGSVTTGFSNGYAGALTLTDGRRAFAKVIAESSNPVGAGMYRDEARITAQLPDVAPTARLLDSFDLGVAGDRWIGLLLSHIDGRPPIAANADDLDLVVELTVRLAELDPCPVAGLHPITAADGTFDRWSGIDRGLPGLQSYRPWLTNQLDRLVETAAGWRQAMAGTALLHGDLRLDNVLIADDAAYAVDWPSAAVGAPWIDTVLALPALAMLPGAPAAESFAARHPLVAAVDPADVDAVLVAAVGFFVSSSLQPPIPGLPTIRAFQRAQADAALDWLQQRWG
ncbi:phosphotransferase [Nakamurella lactea]|uniref:phosphotransferase n=1 Tax=Nakamurella lactea TaxID=459515 RepID=UPI00041B0113|nr:phosphotransferase [Nakamurella lactea]